MYDIASNQWKEIPLPGREGDSGYPLSRSVHALIPVTPAIQNGEDSVVAVMVFGERGPAPAHLGHMGAGKFHDDAWALVVSPKRVNEENVWGFGFEQMEQSEKPEAMGWFASGWWAEGGGLVVQGGLNGDNQRLGDCWIGKIEV